MALKGSLREAALPEILQLLALGEKTGCLSVTEQENFGHIYFRGGRIVFASVVNREERLGERLLLEGTIDNAALEGAVAEQRKNPERRLGELLVERRAVAIEELWRAVADQIEETVYTIFSWRQGFFHFEPEQEPPQGEILVSLDVPTLTLEGARRLDEVARIKKRIPHRRLILARVDGEETNGTASSGAVEASPQQAVLEAVDGVRNVAEIVTAARLEDFRVLKALYDLLGAGRIKVVGESPPALEEGVRRRDECRNLGIAFYETGMYAEAAREFRQMLALDPADSEAHFHLGLVAFRLQRHAEARQEFRRTVELEPKMPAAYLNLALALEALGQEEDARLVLRALHDRLPECPTGRLHEAILHYRAGEYAEALAALEPLELDERLEPVASFYRAMLHALFWDLRSARELLESFPPDGRDVRVLNNLGAVLERADRLEEARASYAAALELEGPSAVPRKNLGDLYYREGKYDAARNAYLLALQDDPALGDVLNRLGNIAFREGRRDEALAYWGKALDLDPADEQARSSVALVRSEAQ